MSRALLLLLPVLILFGPGFVLYFILFCVFILALSVHWVIWLLSRYINREYYHHFHISQVLHWLIKFIISRFTKAGAAFNYCWWWLLVVLEVSTLVLGLQQHISR